MGLNPTSLANLLDVSRTMVHKYEKGEKQPGDQTFTRICDVLSQPAYFFFSTSWDKNYSHTKVHFRDQDSLKLAAREQAGTRLKWLIELYTVLTRKLSLPILNLPTLNIPNDPTQISQELIEQAAIAVRTQWGLEDEPLPNLIRLLELNGVVVGQIQMDMPKMDGASIWSTTHNRPFILLNSDKATCVRSRFDAAHELGHMILHRNVIDGITRGNPIYKLMERQAHRFAAALLLPRSSWAREVRGFTLVGFKSLKPKWQTSIAAMIMRAEVLGLISEANKTSLMRQYSANKWRTGEPMDNIWPLEKPRLFEQSLTLLDKNGFSGTSLLNVFPRKIESVAELTGMPKSFFAEQVIPMTVRSNGLN